MMRKAGSRIATTLVRAIASLSCGAVIAGLLSVATPAVAKQTIDRECDVCGTVVAVERTDAKASGMRARDVGTGGATSGGEGDVRTPWSVSVKMDDGGARSVGFAHRPVYRPGHRVRIVDGTMSLL